MLAFLGLPDSASDSSLQTTEEALPDLPKDLAHDVREYIDHLREVRDKERARLLWIGGPAILTLFLTAVWFLTRQTAQAAATAQFGVFVDSALEAVRKSREALTKADRAQEEAAESSRSAARASNEVSESAVRAKEAETSAVAARNQIDRYQTEALKEAQSAGKANQAAQNAAEALNKIVPKKADGSPATFEDIVQAIADSAVLRKLQQQAKSAAESVSAPVGTIVAWMGPSNEIPENWHECNGAPFDSTWQVEKLQARLPRRSIGAKTIPAKKLPNLQGLFLRGASEPTAETSDVVPKRAPGHRQSDSLRDHAHGLTGSELGSDGVGVAAAHYAKVTDGKSLRQITVEHSIFYTGGVAVHQTPQKSSKTTLPLNQVSDRETRPVNIAVRWIIRVK